MNDSGYKHCDDNDAEGDTWQEIEDKCSRYSDRYIGDGQMDLRVKLASGLGGDRHF
jgi:hypothetical protein